MNIQIEQLQGKRKELEHANITTITRNHITRVETSEWNSCKVRVVSNEQRVENNEQREEKPVKHLWWNFIVSTRWLTGSLLKNGKAINYYKKSNNNTDIVNAH